MLLSVGLLSFGLVHLVTGGLAIYLAVGLDANPSYSGALRIVAARPLGALLMWAMAVGLGTLTAWQLGWAVTWKEREERWTRPVGALGRAITYAVLALLSLGTIRASSDAVSGSSTVSERVLDPADVGGVDLALARVRAHPLGPVALIGIGAGLNCYGVYFLIWSTSADRRATIRGQGIALVLSDPCSERPPPAMPPPGDSPALQTPIIPRVPHHQTRSVRRPGS